MTRIFKVRVFERLTRKTDVDDKALAKAIKEADDGLIDADLGGGLIKKRVARAGGGKRGGYRTIVAYRSGIKAFFLFCFPKNAKDDLDPKEEKSLKEIGAKWLGYSEEQLATEIEAGRLFEVKHGKEEA
jgi:hypothetical protein